MAADHVTGHHGNHQGDHVPGSMDVSVQESTFDGFVRMVRRSVIVILCLLVFIALVNA